MKRLLAFALVLALGFADAPVQADESYDPSDLTVADIYAKRDAAYGKLEPGFYHTVVSVHRPDLDRTVTTYSNGDNFRTVSQGSGFTREFGSLNGQSWNQNENGIVTYEDGFHNDDSNAVAVRTSDNPHFNVRVLGITRDEPRAYVIDINPPGGFDQQRYYDAKTFRLTKVVSYRRDRNRHVTEFSDYRTTFGRTIAYTTHSYDGRPQNDTVSTVTTFEHGGTTADLAVPNGRGLFSYTSAVAAHPIVIPATFTKSGIIVHTQVKGRGLDFLLDSGAGGLFIDPGTAHDLGLTPVGRYTSTFGGGDIDSGTVRITGMKIGDLTADDIVFNTVPHATEVEGMRVVGLMGFDFLVGGVFGIDFKKKTLTLYPPGTFDPNASGLIPQPLKLDDRIPRTDVWVGNQHGNFAVDTGAFAMVVYKDFWKKLPAPTILQRDFTIGTVGGTMQTSVVQIHDLVFGQIKYHDASAVLPTESTFDIMSYDGLLGRDVLGNYETFFDYPDSMMYVRFNG